MDSVLKYHDLTVLLSIVETQVLIIDNLIKGVDDNDHKKFLRTELKELKTLKTKLNKGIREY